MSWMRVAGIVNSWIMVGPGLIRNLMMTRPFQSVAVLNVFIAPHVDERPPGIVANSDLIILITSMCHTILLVHILFSTADSPFELTRPSISDPYSGAPSLFHQG